MEWVDRQTRESIIIVKDDIVLIDCWQQDGYAVSLQMQCYMFIVGHLDELPSDVIALLPIGIRRKLLLLMLPALDVCKLEETPVTDGISMDDDHEYGN